MENQVENFLRTVKSRFPDVKFEIVYNSFSSNLVYFIIKDHEAKGFGGGSNKLIASEKAYSEFIERKTMYKLNQMFSAFKTSNGFAAHYDRQEAIKYSRLELIERDAFLLSWHSKKAPYWIGNEELSSFLTPENTEILDLHRKNFLEIKLGVIAKSEGVYTAISCVRVLGDRFYIDTKSGDSVSEILNNLIESVTFNSHYILKGYKAKRSDAIIQPIDHLNYYLKPRVGLDWFFKGSEEVLLLPAEDIVTYDCNADDLLEHTTDRFVCYSESPSMQEYFCGRFSTKFLNLDRFYRIFGKDIKLNKQIHPLS